MTDVGFAAQVERMFRAAGAVGLSFKVISAFGTNGASTPFARIAARTRSNRPAISEVLIAGDVSTADPDGFRDPRRPPCVCTRATADLRPPSPQEEH